MAEWAKCAYFSNVLRRNASSAMKRIQSARRMRNASPGIWTIASVAALFRPQSVRAGKPLDPNHPDFDRTTIFHGLDEREQTALHQVIMLTGRSTLLMTLPLAVTRSSREGCNRFNDAFGREIKRRSAMPSLGKMVGARDCTIKRLPVCLTNGSTTGLPATGARAECLNR